MIVAEIDINWTHHPDLAVRLLQSIQFLSEQKGMQRIDGDGFKVYWAGSVLRIDIEGGALTDGA